MQITLQIPDLLRAQPPGEQRARLLLELAVALYARDSISLAQGAELTGMSRMDFGWEVGERGVPRHYGEADFAEDAAYAGRF